jgi:NAD(P)-dependent dehydrogenase (short-subunit alcohol dehydrogenase family)
MVKTQFDINVFGILRAIRSFLPHLRAQPAPTQAPAHYQTNPTAYILNVSSIGGLRSYASNGVYCATKFALEGITQALALEIAPFGLHAAVVEPGYFRTAFLAGVTGAAAAANIAPALSVYEGTVAHEARASFTAYDGRQPGNPVEGAKRIWEYVAGEGLFVGKERRGRLPLGSDTGNVLREVSQELAETAKVYEEVWSSTDFKE